MKTLLPFIALLLITLESCKHCEHGVHEDATKYFSESGFTEIDAGGNFNVKIVQGDSYAIEARTEERLLSHVDMKRRGDKLIMEVHGWHVNNCSKKIQVTVTMPELKGIQSSGGSYFYSEQELHGSNLKIDASGGSQVDLDINYAVVNLEGSGGSKMDLNGTGSDLNIKMSGGSRMELFDLNATICDVDASGGSHAEVSVSTDLSVDLSGGSKVLYKGTPGVHVKTTGGSSVEKQ